MSGEDAGTLLKGGGEAPKDQSQGQHSPREEFDGNLQDDEVGFLPAVVLREGVHEGEHECGGEDGGLQDVACEGLGVLVVRIHSPVD